MQTTFYPRHAFKVEHAQPVPVRHLARAASRPGDWHYYGLPKPGRLSFWPAVLFSLSVHGLVLWGGGERPALRPVVVVKDDPIIQMVMPDLPEEEEKPVEELEEQVELDPGVVVPRLVDLPSAVDLKNAFVQPLDMSVSLQTGLDTGKLTSIPLKIATGRQGGGMKDLFNISQLDRVPEPIVQQAPQFPIQLKKDVESAEVVVEFIVDSRGDTRDVRVVSSSHPGFDFSAIEGVRKWRFRPGMKTGRKVNTRMLVPIRFTVLPGD